MITKQIYNRNLNEAIDTILADRREVSIPTIFTQLRNAGFKYAMPAPTTVAKLPVNRGWAKHQASPRSRAVYLRPAVRSVA